MTRHRVLLGLSAGVLVASLAGLSPASGIGYPLTAVVSDNPVNSTPHVLDNAVTAIAEIGNTVRARVSAEDPLSSMSLPS